MQQIIYNLFKKAKGLDLSHKAFFVLFVFNAVIWSGVFDESSLHKNGYSNLNNKEANSANQLVKKQILCESAKWQSRSTTHSFKFEITKLVIFTAQGSRDSTARVKSNSRSLSKIPYFMGLNIFDFLQRLISESSNLKKRGLMIFLVNHLNYEIVPLRGPPLN